MINDVPFFNDEKFYKYIGNELDELANKDLQFQFSGNPYTDNGIIIISNLYEIYFDSQLDPRKLMMEHVIKVFRHGHGNMINGKELAWINYLSKATQMLIPNNPLIQVAFTKKIKSASITDERVQQANNAPSLFAEHIYVYYLLSFLKSFVNQESEFQCSFCGVNSIFDFHSLESSIQETIFNNINSFSIGIAKLWYPLVGTIGGEAQVFSGYSGQPTICGKCLFVVHFLPQGVGLFKGKVLLYQTNDIEITKELIKPNIHEIQAKFITSPEAKIDSPGKGKSYLSFYNDLLDVFKMIQKAKDGMDLTFKSSLMLWAFTNSNQDVAAFVEELPSDLLKYLYEFDKRWSKTLRRFLTTDEKSNRATTFIDSLKKEKEYYGFYSSPTKNIVNQEFYEFYQLKIVERTVPILNFYKIVAKSIISNSTQDSINSIFAKNNFREKRQMIYRAVMNCMLEGKLVSKIIVQWALHENNNSGFKPFDYYFHPDADLTTSGKVIDNLISDDRWVVIEVAASHYLNRASNRGGFTEHSLFSTLNKEPTNQINKEYSLLSSFVPGLSWMKKIDVEKISLSTIRGKQIAAFFLFRIAVIERMKSKNYEIINPIYDLFNTLDELEFETLLTEKLINTIYNYIKIRSFVEEYSLKRSVLDLKRLFSESKMSFDSTCSFLRKRGIEVDKIDFIDSQVISENYQEKNYPEFSWYFMKQQIINFLDQLILIKDWGSQLKLKLEEM